MKRKIGDTSDHSVYDEEEEEEEDLNDEFEEMLIDDDLEEYIKQYEEQMREAEKEFEKLTVENKPEKDAFDVDDNMDDYIKMYEESEDQAFEENIKHSKEEEIKVDPFYRYRLDTEDFAKLKRPLPEHGYLNESLKFMALKVEYDVGYRDTEKYGKTRKSELFLDIFGTTKEGYDVRCKVIGFKPYFYVEVSKKLFNTDMIAFKNALFDKIDASNIRMFKDLEIIDSVEKLVKKSVYGFSLEDKYFFKITSGFPQYISRLKTIFEEGFDIDGFGNAKFLTYESNIAFHIRCMIDKKINGSAWIEIKPEDFHIVRYKESHCAIEVEVRHEDMVVHKPGKTWYEIAPIRLLSYDIECLGTGDHFPDANLGDKIICVSLVVKDTNKKERTSILLALEETKQTEGCTTYWFKKEEDLLTAFRDMVVAINPDFLTGYNISKFDNSYLFKRATCLGLHDFFKLSKIKYKTCNLRISTSYSAQSGSKVSENAVIYGRSNFDMHPIIIGSGFKFNDYTLNTVSREILKDQKNDLHYSHIPRLFSGAKEKKNGNTFEFVATPETRERIASYCEKDSVLPLDLIEKIKSIETFVESSRVIGIPIHDLVEKGASLRSYTQFLAACQEAGFLVPVNPCEKVDFQGAFVFTPEPGFYKKHIAAFDFNSLYPSIMIMINGDPSTLIPQNLLHLFKKEDYVTYEIKILNKKGEHLFSRYHSFVKKSVREGILPSIERKLLGARAEVRKEIKVVDVIYKGAITKKLLLNDLKKNSREEIRGKYLDKIKIEEEKLEKNKSSKTIKEELDSLLVAVKILDSITEDEQTDETILGLEAEIIKLKVYLDVLDKRQLAYKVAANSLYGWIAASTNSTACVPVSETITSIGRELINDSKVFIEKTFTKKNKFDADLTAIYGDTDSVYVKFDYDTMPEMQKVFDDAKFVSAETTKYIQSKYGSTVVVIAFEKVFKGLILLKRKKYVGLKYEDGSEPKIDSKGLDDVRRETTRMTKTIIQKMFKLIFFDNNIEACKDLIKEKISDLYQQKVNIYELISSKKLKSEELYKTKPIHCLLNEKLKKRGSEGYRAGDRVLFVVTAPASFKSKKTNSKGKISSTKDKVSERGEDPLYAHHHNLKLDINYYFENQLKKPLERIFTVVIKDIGKLFSGGEHMRHKVEITPDIFEMSKFVFKVEKCMGCGKVIDMEDLCKGPICSGCAKEGLLISKYEELINKKNEIVKKEGECLEECYKCQGFVGDVLCSNVNACANFWVKGSVEKQLKDVDTMLSKFKR